MVLNPPGIPHRARIVRFCFPHPPSGPPITRPRASRGSAAQTNGGDATAAAQACQAAGRSHIYLTGRPAEREAALRLAGVRDFIFAGGDALAVLNDTWRRLEQR